MQTRIDPKSGSSLSILGFGCMRFSRGLNMKIDLDKAEPLVLSAVERGVNYFDTAYVYGGSEAALGEIFRKNGGVREKINLATKLPHQQCKAYEDFDRIFGEQCRRLHTDFIDYYLLHNLSSLAGWDAMVGLGIEKWIQEKKSSGQIRRIGFSFHGSQHEFMSLLDAYPWEFCQIQYNYMNETYQAGRAGLLRAHEKGLPVIAMEPLLGGKLATGLPKRAENLFQDADSERTPAGWGMRWLWDQPEVTVVLSGMNSMEQLEDNVKTAETAVPHMLTQREAAVYPRVVSIFRDAYKIPCTGCNYCMPCPNKVNIPGCFAAYNTSYAVGMIAGMTQYATSTGSIHPGENFGPGSCVKCGQCEKKCPQHIPIMKSLEDVKRRMDPFWFRAALGLFQKFSR